MGRPWLLKWVLQHKEMYSGVLHGLGNDDDNESFIYVLSTLKERVLVEESLVPLVLWTFGFLVSQSRDRALFDSEDVQSIIECLYPFPFIWSLINKGLLHSDFLVKYGILRLLSEALKLLDWTPLLVLWTVVLILAIKWCRVGQLSSKEFKMKSELWVLCKHVLLLLNI